MSSVSAPNRTREQRLAALELANAVRTRRSQLKEAVARGRRLASDVLEHVPTEAETMKVLELVLAMPRVGGVKAVKMLARAEIAASKTVGGLSERQRRALRVLVCAEQARYESRQRELTHV